MKPEVLAAVAAVVSAAATLMTILFFWRQAHHLGRKNVFDALLHANDVFSSRLTKEQLSELYGLRELFKDGLDGSEPKKFEQNRTPAFSPVANPEWGEATYHYSLRERIVRVNKLTRRERERRLDLIEPYVGRMNELGEMIHFGFIEPKALLSKYHLSIAREVFIAEPYIYREMIWGQRGRWGFRVLRLGEMARAYNDLNPIHREPIFFYERRRRDDRYGPIYQHPPRNRWFTLRAFVRRHTVGYPTVTRRVQRRQQRYLERLREELRAHDQADTPELDDAWIEPDLTG